MQLPIQTPSKVSQSRDDINAIKYTEIAGSNSDICHIQKVLGTDFAWDTVYPVLVFLSSSEIFLVNNLKRRHIHMLR